MEDIKLFKEQLDILKERGLIIDNEDKALKSLQYINFISIREYRGVHFEPPLHITIPKSMDH